jgi:hypothetical protein
MNTYSELARRAPSLWDSRSRSKVAAGDLPVRQSRTNAVCSISQRQMVACATRTRAGAHGCAPLGNR